MSLSSSAYVKTRPTVVGLVGLQSANLLHGGRKNLCGQRTTKLCIKAICLVARI